ncbi:DUF3618 domain-containing protein [Mycolicibacterium pyrenivorans]|uniref:DUF3618 domain-containing protein n=1 Tax=Mycolicibacterium pyrenivorans TaxID=187102 RepID=UPI0021F2BA86|nr:DUF3618 domain-containing protein [Mycolicibacterium pyrenivorans]MCV7153961.1 DUF3618 domain-containing protein [Mycolicibacterium pyrenivorans]
MASADSLPPEPGPDADIDELQADIEKTRAELGETVGALSDKLDVKTRAHDKAAETKEAVVQRAHTATESAKSNPAVPAGVVVAVVAAIGLLWWWRRR